MLATRARPLTVLAATRSTDGVGGVSRRRCPLWSGCHEFLLGERDRVKEGLHRSFAEAPTSLVRAALIVIGDPRIEISLQLIDAAIDLLAKSNPIELVQRG